MKWISHKLTTGVIYYTITGNPFESLIAATASIIPDAIELGPGRFIFRKHRGISHNPLFWIIALPFLLLLLIKFVPDVPSLRIDPGSVFTAITAGVLLHLFLDSLSEYGIPLWGKRRFALKLYQTFSISEFFVVFAITIGFGIYVVWKNL